ncbi:unnamed protein product [Dimorphilus gyrociliatus]|uniref:CRAL-TRIO domain-containing protein n=1 Tax=Dimorphilus gyrociliatus TaxID=2664684 RepID=A0A7I8VN00_9ANNE|nr:unnamed protein product [Dimorphilus gyrociliatus]
MSLIDIDKEEYICSLDEKSIEKARKELNENPKDRLSSLTTFRKWIEEQKYLRCDTSAHFLLPFLRTAKFSQLKARSMLEGYLTVLSKHPERFGNIDVKDERFMNTLNQGDILPLPRYDKHGRKVVLHIVRNLNTKGEVSSVDLLRKWWAQALLLRFDERVQVNGIAILLDCSGYNLKHFEVLSLEERKQMQALWQGNMPTRFKQFIMYNIGGMFKVIFQMVKPFISKKFQQRTKVVNSLEEIYKEIPLENLPEEYLPDDYVGKGAGKLADLMEDHKLDLLKNRDRILHATDPSKYFYDINMKDKSVIQQSYRKISTE